MNVNTSGILREISFGVYEDEPKGREVGGSAELSKA